MRRASPASRAGQLSFRAKAIVSASVRPGQAIIYHAWENYQFEGGGHFKSVMAAPLNPIELVGDYGHIRPDALIAMPGQSDRDTRVEVRKLEGAYSDSEVAKIV